MDAGTERTWTAALLASNLGWIVWGSSSHVPGATESFAFAAMILVAMGVSLLAPLVGGWVGLPGTMMSFWQYLGWTSAAFLASMWAGFVLYCLSVPRTSDDMGPGILLSVFGCATLLYPFAAALLFGLGRWLRHVVL